MVEEARATRKLSRDDTNPKSLVSDRAPGPRQKTFTGCKTCRRRKIKCPTERPACSRCIRAGLKCPGYGPNIVWLPVNTEASTAQGLGGLPDPRLTWESQRILDMASVDSLILSLTTAATTQFGRTLYQSATRGPFSVMSFPHHRPRQPSRCAEYATGSATIPGSIQPVLPLDQENQFLFSHYVSVVASKMMPFDDSRNPWKSRYPSMALDDESLACKAIRYAILSQAAAHLQHMGHFPEQMKVLAMSHYSKALTALAAYLGDRGKYDFVPLLASILSLIMAETYEGGSAGWRQHLKSAWDLAIRSLPQKPWQSSETAWLTTQSLCMLRLRMNVGLEHGDFQDEAHSDRDIQEIITETINDDYAFRELIASVSSRYDFGFTVGASARSAQGLCEAVHLVRQIQSSGLNAANRIQVERLVEQLTAVPSSTYERNYESIRQIHENIFSLGTIIYLLRHTVDPPPASLLPYTSALFAFFETMEDLLAQVDPAGSTRRGSADVTLWPVFIAAVECFRPEEQRIARRWLESLSRSGIGNRSDVSKVVLSVWLHRRLMCQAQSIEEEDDSEENIACDEMRAGETTVRWQWVMRTQKMDILLV